MTRYIAERPWLFVVATFALLASLWACFIYIAVTHGPVSFDLNSEPASIHAVR
jgi:hypothetical protein